MSHDKNDYVFFIGTELILEIDGDCEPGTGRVVDIFVTSKSKLRAKSVGLAAVRELNQDAVDVQYRLAGWQGSWLDKPQKPKLGQLVQFQGETAVPLGKMNAYLEFTASELSKINKIKLKIFDIQRRAEARGRFLRLDITDDDSGLVH